MKKAAILTSVAILWGGATPAFGQLVLEYVETNDLGGNQWEHVYKGVRDAAETAIAKDVHIEGHYQWQPGTVTLDGPIGWDGVYNGPFFTWYSTGSQYDWEPGDPLVLEPFIITVDNPTLVNSPFHWTDNAQQPWDGASGIIANGVGSVPAPVPEPGQTAAVLLAVAGVTGVFFRRRRTT